MNQTITRDKDKWNAARYDRHHADMNDTCLPLPWPGMVEVKGYALMPAILDENGAALTCETRVIKGDDSVRNYDFSDCYVYDYTMNYAENKYVEEEGDMGPFRIYNSRFVRYTGEAKRLENPPRGPRLDPETFELIED